MFILKLPSNLYVLFSFDDNIEQLKQSETNYVTIDIYRFTHKFRDEKCTCNYITRIFLNIIDMTTNCIQKVNDKINVPV